MNSKIPNSYKEAKRSDHYQKLDNAIEEEIKSLNKNNTWEFVQRSADMEVIGCRWVFNIKNDERGNPARYKARLVAKGYDQQYLIDYEETFAPVARITSFRFLMAIANQFGLMIHHMDVKTAFLNGILQEDIYVYESS